MINLRILLLLFILGSCVSVFAGEARERAFNNNFAENAAMEFFEKHEVWPTSIDDLVVVAKERGKSEDWFRGEDYHAIGFKVLSNGKLQLELTAPSGKTKVRICDKPSTSAEAIIKKEGYLIVHDGSSFYYLGGDGLFISGPLDSWCGRAIEGTYQTGFRATGVMYFFNRLSARTRYEMEFEIISVERDGEPFDPKNFGFFEQADRVFKRISGKPVFHKAYFIFRSLVPLKK